MSRARRRCVRGIGGGHDPASREAPPHHHTHACSSRSFSPIRLGRGEAWEPSLACCLLLPLPPLGCLRLPVGCAVLSVAGWESPPFSSPLPSEAP